MGRTCSDPCEQLDGLLQERGEGVFPLEVVYDQVGPVEPCEVEGMSEANGCTESLGGMEAPGTLVVIRFPSVVVPVCVCLQVWRNACCNARIARVKGVV